MVQMPCRRLYIRTTVASNGSRKQQSGTSLKQYTPSILVSKSTVPWFEKDRSLVWEGLLFGLKRTASPTEKDRFCSTGYSD